MIRYLVFVYRDYYPNGGWGDIAGGFATEGEARAFIATHRADWARNGETGCNLVDLERVTPGADLYHLVIVRRRVVSPHNEAIVEQTRLNGEGN